MSTEIEISKLPQPAAIKLRFSPSQAMPEEEFLRSIRQIARETGAKIQSMPAVDRETKQFIPDTNDYLFLIMTEELASKERMRSAVREKIKEKKLESYLATEISL